MVAAAARAAAQNSAYRPALPLFLLKSGVIPLSRRLRALTSVAAGLGAVAAGLSSLMGMWLPAAQWRCDRLRTIEIRDGLLMVHIEYHDKLRSLGPGWSNELSRWKPSACISAWSHINSASAQYYTATWTYALPAWWVGVVAGAAAILV